MNLQPGCRFVVAPHFHLPIDWPRRLLVEAGVEETDGGFFPQHSWRPPTPDELSLLVRASDGPTTPEELEACVCLFHLPGHLRSAWWNLLEQAAGVLGPGEGYRLPSGGLILNSYLADKQEADVLLWITHERARSTGRPR